MAPVDAQPQTAPDVLENLLVLDREDITQFDEVASRDRDLTLGVGLLRRPEVRVVGDRRVTTHAVVVLNPTLGGQTVVVPPHGVEHGLAVHPLKTRDRVGVCVGEHVTDVQRSRDRGRWRVDGEDTFALDGAVEVVDAGLIPYVDPLRLDTVQRRLVGHAEGMRAVGHGSNVSALRSLLAPCSSAPPEGDMGGSEHCVGGPPMTGCVTKTVHGPRPRTIAGTKETVNDSHG